MNTNIFYNAQHSPVGAFASFTLGHKGASGGLGMELAGPARQNVYIGAESKISGRYQALPFYKDKDAAEKRADIEPVAQNIWRQDDEPDAAAGDDRAGASHAPADGGIARDNAGRDNAGAALAADPDGAAADGSVITPFADGEITREITPATDTWRAGDLEFKIYTPHLPVPDPGAADQEELKRAVIPAVFVELTLDNTNHPHHRKAFFGYEGNDPYSGMRRYSAGEDGDGAGGVGQGKVTGIFTDCGNADCALAFSVSELLAAKDLENKLPFGLGTTGLVLLTAPANTKKTWRFAVCFYRGGAVTSGLESSYLYTRFYEDIEEVAWYGLRDFEFYRQAAASHDKMFDGRDLSGERLFMLSQAVKSYYGSTQLLEDGYGEPQWVVNEGAYRMINTLDLAIDHLFFEMRMNPWVVRSVLELYADEYCYEDQVKDKQGGEYPGGVSFAHDMGVANVFSEPPMSAYELRGLKGCYSYMTHEQLVNWVLCAGVYWAGASHNAWIEDYQYLIKDCLTSMINRDGVGGIARDGVMDMDSCMTGGGAEITTYDNVDTALGRARRNSYLAVKCWAAYLAMEKMFEALGQKTSAKTSADQAARCAATILKYKKPDGTIPALLEDGNKAITLSIVEGLVYPYVMGMFDDPQFIAKYKDFIDALQTHFETALKSGCKFADGSWKMSKTSENSWLSKTFLCQFIAEKIFGFAPDVHADKVHASWLLDPDNAIFAFSDQMKAGKVCGSMFYPRGVTGILWC